MWSTYHTVHNQSLTQQYPSGAITDCFLNFLQTSAQHARLDKRGGDHFVTCLGSSAGTWLNEKKLEPNTAVILHPGMYMPCP